LAKDEIRVQYSGFVIFGAQMVSVVTGLVFTLLLTRNMSESQFGIWSNIFDYTAYFTILSSLFPFWVTRFVARGKEGTVKTSLFASSVLALVSMGIYLSLISSITTAIHTEVYLVVYLIAVLQILNAYLITNLESCFRGVKPQTIGYGLLIEEVIKVALALVIIAGFHEVFLGAMLSITLSALIQALYYIRVLGDYLKEKVRWSYLKEWLKGSVIFVYNGVGSQLVAFVFILLFIYGGQEARADYQAATTFATIVGYSASLAVALYPRLLVKKCPDDQVSLSFKMVLMFAIPLAAITIVMSESFLTVLNAAYAEASPILILLTFDTLITLVSQFYSSCLLGSEELDVEGKIPLGKLLRSKIFKVFSFPYIQAAIALPLVYFVLTQLQIANPVEAVLYVTAINIVVHLITFVGLYLLARKFTRIVGVWKNIGKYLMLSIVAAVILFLLPMSTTIIWTFGKAAVGLSIYAALLIAVDAEARVLVRAIFQEVRSNISVLARRQG
jgi:O-antigen/teichoic acid export membrane protein